MNPRITGLCLLPLLLAACAGVTDQAEMANDTAPSKPNIQAVAAPKFTKETEAVEVYYDMAELSADESMNLEPEAPVVDPETFFEEQRENYVKTRINPFYITQNNPVSTFSTDVDTASYTNARRFLRQGQLPPISSIRVEEFINYFDYQLDAPETLSQPIRIDTEVADTPWNANTKLMRVSLQTYQANFNQLPPLNLVFLLDVSGSMNSADKLPLMQRSFELLVNQLRPEDHVAIAVYAGDSGVVLEPTSGKHKTSIINAIKKLRAGGSTHGSAGIKLAYQLAEEHFNKDGINRIFIGTDGDFNVGMTDMTSLKNLVENKRENGVFLSVLGFGSGNYNDALMEEMSNHGNGTAYYIDSYQEARKLFSEQLAATLQTVAKDVKIQVEFNPAKVAEYRLIGYDNRQLNREDFNNDRIDAGDMGSGHSATALYEIVLTDSDYRINDDLRYQAKDNANASNPSDELAFVKVRYKLPNERKSTKITQPVTPVSAAPTTAMVLSTTVAGFAESLRQSPYLKDYSIDQAITNLKSTLQDDRWGYRQELLQLMRNATAHVQRLTD